MESNLMGIGIVGYYEETEMEKLFPLLRQLEECLSNISLSNYLKDLYGLTIAAYCLPLDAYEKQKPEVSKLENGIITLSTLIDPATLQEDRKTALIQQVLKSFEQIQGLAPDFDLDRFLEDVKVALE